MKVSNYIKKCHYDGVTYLWTLDNEMLADIDIENTDEPFRVRGWGSIQYMFRDPKTDQIDFDKAAKFQDEVAQFIADAINEKIERELEEE
jgi:hypothetical protein